MTPPNAPEIFDVTIRDGSYVIDFQFHPEDVQLLYRALDNTGMPYIEVGHGFGLNASAVKGAAAGTDDEYLSAAAAACKQSRFGTFFIPGIGDREHLRRARLEYGMHFVRIGNDPDKLETFLPFLEYARELGLEVMANFMKSYTVSPAELAAKAKVLHAHGAEAIYVVDSAGGMLPEEVGTYVRALAEATPARIGFHGHNNLELAVSNTVSAWQNGATLLDCSIGGLGRSSGNTRTELLIPVLRSMGVALPYDFQGVLRIWQDVLRPILQRRPVEALEVVGGYARIHSGAMKPFADAARRHHVNLEGLVEAYGDALHGRRPSAGIDELASELAVWDEEGARARRSGTLLKMQTDVADPHAVRNTFRSLDEVLRAARVLSRKAFLPVVAVVSIEPTAADEAYVTGEYLYHDDHFIVVRAAFSSVALFAEVMSAHRGKIDILVFETATNALRRELTLRKDEWLRDERVVWRNVPSAKYHYLFGLLYQVAATADARSVLIFGATADRLTAHGLPGSSDLEIYCAVPDASALHNVRVVPLHVGIRDGVRADGRRLRFDVAVLVAPISGKELEGILSAMPPSGIILDCLDQAGLHRAILKHMTQRVVSVSLSRGLTGELLNLLDSEACRNAAPASEAAGLEFRTNEQKHERRAA